MKSKSIIFSIIACLLCIDIIAQGWTQRANFPIVNTTATGFSINGKGYVYGGSINSNVEYDPSTDTWTYKNPIPIKGVNMISFVIGNKVYVGMPDAMGGLNDTLYEYDPSTDGYAFKTKYPGPTSVSGKNVFTIGNKAYICLGNTTLGNNQMWEYEPTTNTWTQKSSPPVSASTNYAAFSLNNKGYICLAGTLAEYNPANDSWTTKTPMPNGNNREGHRAFTIGNYAFVGSGGYLFNNFRDFYKYDPTIDSWSIIDSLPIGSSNAVTFTIGNKGYYVLGQNGMMNFQIKTWEYSDPSIPVGIKDQVTAYYPINLYPNPSNGQFTIQSDKESVFELTDITGRVINSYKVNGKLDVSESLPAGMYFVRDRESGMNQKLIIKD